MYFAKKYNDIVSQNLFVTNTVDISGSKPEYINFRLCAIGIENYLPIQSQFLYLLMLTRIFPFMARKHPSKKKFRFGDYRVGDNAKFVSYINQYRVGYLIHKLHDFMPKQLSPEYSAITFNFKYAKVIIWNAPLYNDTFCLETSENSFLGDIPVYYKFITKKNMFAEIAFWVFFYEFLRPADLLSTIKLDMQYYDYNE